MTYAIEGISGLSSVLYGRCAALINEAGMGGGGGYVLSNVSLTLVAPQ